MDKRTFPGIGVTASALGFGAMRLPTLSQDSKDIDFDHSTRMIHAALDGGVKYIDTAYVYHGGVSEVAVGKALKGGKRQNVLVATKLPLWTGDLTHAGLERMLDESLSRLGTDVIDFYLLHAVDSDRVKSIAEGDVYTFLDNMVRKGKIRFPSFSFHDELSVYKELIDAYDWKMSQVQINILDGKHQAGLEGIKYAASKGIGIVAMEPLRGGQLARRVPDGVQALYDAHGIRRTAVDWAFRYLANMPEIKVILSGMSTLEQVEDNLRIFNDETMTANSLSAADKDLLARVTQQYLGKIEVGCTGCEYCLPCPQGVEIPRILRRYDTACMFDEKPEALARIKKMNDENKGPSACVVCGACEGLCPQKLPIIKELARIGDML